MEEVATVKTDSLSKPSEDAGRHVKKRKAPSSKPASKRSSATPVPSSSATKSNATQKQVVPVEKPKDEARDKAARDLFAAFIACMQSYDTNHYSTFFSEHAAANITCIVIQVEKFDMSENLTMYREIRGSLAVQSYLYAKQLTYPDGLAHHRLTRVEVVDQADCKHILHGDFQFEGHKLHNIDVTDELSAFLDTESVACALTGLQSLASGSSGSSTPQSFTASDHERDDDSSQSAKREGRAKRRLDCMQVFVSTEQARFQRGAKLPRESMAKLHGSVQLHVSPEDRIYRIKYSF